MYIECPYCKVKKELLKDNNYSKCKFHSFKCWNINCRKQFKVFKNINNEFISITEEEYEKEWLEN